MTIATQINAAKAVALANRLNLKVNALMGYQSDQLTTWLSQLLAGDRIEVGWRESCSATDRTLKIYREWKRVLKELRKSGLEVSEENVNHKNAYAGNNGGFWNSIIYTINQPQSVA